MADIGQSISGKISPKTFGRDCRRRYSLARPYGNRPPRRYFLIICEGEKTEPNYFNAIAAKLPRVMVNHVTVRGFGRNPVGLIEEAKKEIKKRRSDGLPDYYYVWLVFDKDEISDSEFNRVIDVMPELSDKKMSGCRSVAKWDCAWSNEAFELWYVLHFCEQLGGAVSREKFQKMLEDCIRANTAEKNFVYKKNDPDMFARLERYTPDAINRAERALRRQIESGRKTWAEMNPATRIHELVRVLLAYL